MLETVTALKMNPAFSPTHECSLDGRVISNYPTTTFRVTLHPLWHLVGKFSGGTWQQPVQAPIKNHTLHRSFLHWWICTLSAICLSTHDFHKCSYILLTHLSSKWFRFSIKWWCQLLGLTCHLILRSRDYNVHVKGLLSANLCLVSPRKHIRNLKESACNTFKW